MHKVWVLSEMTCAGWECEDLPLLVDVFADPLTLLAAVEKRHPQDVEIQLCTSENRILVQKLYEDGNRSTFPYFTYEVEEREVLS